MPVELRVKIFVSFSEVVKDLVERLLAESVQELDVDIYISITFYHCKKEEQTHWLGDWDNGH
jgi:hypothetical protein